jgi:hypothetical protein
MRNTEVNAKENTSPQDVIPALVAFLNRYDITEIATTCPATVQEMFNDLMCTEAADSAQYRERMRFSLLIIADLGNTLLPFTDIDASAIKLPA